MSNQQEWENELLSYASRLGPQHTQQLARIHAESGPDGVLQALAGTGLSRGALEVAAATMDHVGFAGAVQVTEGRLQEIAQVNVETRCGEWMAENGIKPDPNATATQQVTAIHKVAAQQGITPIEVARTAGLVTDPAEAAAQAARADREKQSPGEPTRTQWLLENSDFHRAASASGKTAPAFLKELLALGELGDFEAIEKRAPGLFMDGSEAREWLGKAAAFPATDRLVAELGEHDGEALPERPAPDPEDGWGLSESWSKAAAKQHRTQPRRSQAAEIDDDARYDAEAAHRSAAGESHEGMAATPKVRAYVARRSAAMVKEAAHDGDDWDAHIRRSFGREDARISGGDEAAAAYDRQQSTMSGLASEFDSQADAAEAEAA